LLLATAVALAASLPYIALVQFLAKQTKYWKTVVEKIG